MTPRPTALGAYLTAVAVPGAAAMGYAIAGTRWSGLGPHATSLGVLAIVLLLGELRPIPVVRGDEAGDEISISTTVALALLFLAPPGVAVAAQAIALVADEARARRDWPRLFFNIGQYTLALLAAAGVYTWLSGIPLFAVDRSLAPGDLGTALLASLTFSLVNNVFADIAVAIKLRTPVLHQIVDDLRHHVVVNGVLIGLGPLFAQAVVWSPWSLPLLVLPLVAVHYSARMAAARQHDALHDTLTGLPNRSLFTRRLQEACRQLDREPFAVMLLDLDHFKEINDTLGHHVGDLLLTEVAQRLVTRARAGTTVARLGGDEFAVLAPGIADPAAAEVLGERLSAELARPFLVTGVRLDVSGSAGISVAPRDGLRADDLLRRADVALYRAKEERGRHMQYDAARDVHSVERLRLLGQLRDGIATGELHPVYQPVTECATGRVLGVEALARWQHVERGLLGPDQFIAIAENTGLIDRLTLDLLAASLVALKRWHADGHPLALSINLSPRSLTHERFADAIAEVLAEHGVEPRWLTVEVTESIIVRELTRSRDNLAALRETGVRVAIDDFGTGYSSLAYLKRLPVDSIKIDQSFVRTIAETPPDDRIASTIIRLGHDFGLSVVAEGIEHESVLTRLAELGCDAAQGYFVSRPITAEQMDGWLAARHGVRTV